MRFGLLGIEVHEAADQIEPIVQLAGECPLKARILLLAVIRTILSVGTLNINVICLADLEEAQCIDEVSLFDLYADLVLLRLCRRENIALVFIGSARYQSSRVEGLAVADVSHDIWGKLVAQCKCWAGCMGILALLSDSRITGVMHVQTERQLEAVIHELHRIDDVIARHLLFELQRRFVVGQRHAWPRIAAVEIAGAGPQIVAARVTVDPVLINTDDVVVADLARAEVAAQSCPKIDARMTERPILCVDTEIAVI